MFFFVFIYLSVFFNSVLWFTSILGLRSIPAKMSSSTECAAPAPDAAGAAAFEPLEDEGSVGDTKSPARDTKPWRQKQYFYTFYTIHLTWKSMDRYYSDDIHKHDVVNWTYCANSWRHFLAAFYPSWSLPTCAFCCRVTSLTSRAYKSFPSGSLLALWRVHRAKNHDFIITSPREISVHM